MTPASRITRFAGKRDRPGVVLLTEQAAIEDVLVGLRQAAAGPRPAFRLLQLLATACRLQVHCRSILGW